MRPVRTIVAAIAIGWGAVSLAQDGSNVEQLKRMYDDAIAQLKAAQERRNELARENENLRARVQELQQVAKTHQAKVQQLADKTFQARSEQATLEAFLEANPDVRARWQRFVARNMLIFSPQVDLFDRDWPISEAR